MIGSTKTVEGDVTYDLSLILHNIVDDKHHVESSFDQHCGRYVMALGESRIYFPSVGSYCRWRSFLLYVCALHSGLWNYRSLDRRCTRLLAL